MPEIASDQSSLSPEEHPNSGCTTMSMASDALPPLIPTLPTFSEPRGTTRSEAGQHAIRSALLSVPAACWLILFLWLPLVLLLAASFLSRSKDGGVTFPLALENYARLVGFGSSDFSPEFPLMVLRSVVFGLATAVLCSLAGLPMAFFIAGLPDRWKRAALIVVVIPFWTNLMIRTYAWQLLLGPDSLLAQTAASLGWLPHGEGLYPGPLAVLIGMVCDYLPLLVLPLYASVERMDRTLAEAAADLGAKGWNVFRHAVLPQIRPGLIVGYILVFLPATGQFVVPDLLGSESTKMLGNAIQDQFLQSRDWPFGAALASAALVIVMIGLIVYAWNSPGRKARQPL